MCIIIASSPLLNVYSILINYVENRIRNVRKSISRKSTQPSKSFDIYEYFLNIYLLFFIPFKFLFPMY